MPQVSLQVTQEESTTTQAAQQRMRKAYIPELGGYSDIPVYSRYALLPGTSFPGPAIIEERESTTIVGPGSHCTIDEQWNLIVEFDAGL